jgi:hypothetical protein
VAVPAALLAQQRNQTILTYVMVVIAAISLLLFGIGIMNIVLARCCGSINSVCLYRTLRRQA